MSRNKNVYHYTLGIYCNIYYFFSFVASLLLADPDLIKILGAITIILMGIFTTVILILTMPV